MACRLAGEAGRGLEGGAVSGAHSAGRGRDLAGRARGKSRTSMGIDIYAEWKGQTKEEKDAQITGFSTIHGHTGYLREAYHGEPYATRFLVREAFDGKDGRAAIPADVLRERLPETLELVEEREREIYGEKDWREIAKVKKSFSDFVELCEVKERETGEPVSILASH